MNVLRLRFVEICEAKHFVSNTFCVSPYGSLLYNQAKKAAKKEKEPAAPAAADEGNDCCKLHICVGKIVKVKVEAISLESYKSAHELKLSIMIHYA